MSSFFLYCSILLWVLCKAEIQSIVHTTYGPIEGTITSKIRQFLSIPYAAPSNTTRWQLPQPHKPWSSILQTVDIPPGCPQQCSLPIPTECPQVIQEDCLYLNVITPLSEDYNSTNYPVIVYIHGGGFHLGYGYGICYNSTHNVNATNTIYVTINYRLGALGFLWDDSIGFTGNYGYRDQLFALEWIYDNIHNFGGDRESIVINGQSSGCESVFFHLTNQTSPIIKGAIMESCANSAGHPYYTPKIWSNLPMEFEAAIGCNITNTTQRLNCMMKVDNNTLVEQQTQVGIKWGPTVQSADKLFSDQPIFLYQKGLTLNVPFIMGNCFHELGCGNDKPVSYDTLQNNLDSQIGKDNADKVLKYYNASSICGGPNGNCVNISCEISTDYKVKCVTRNMTASSSINHPNTNFYEYQFNHGNSFNPILYSNKPYCWDIPCHGAELWDVFYSPNAMKEILNITFTADETILAEQFVSYWTNFAKTPFNPNIKRNKNQNIIEWKPYNQTDREILLFDIGNKYQLVQNYDLELCNFWDSLNWTWYKTD
eukprot:284880_1